MDLGVAIAFGSGRQQVLGFLGQCQAQRRVSTKGTDFQGLDGEPHVVEGASRRSEMQDIVDGAGHFDVMGHVLVDVSEPGVIPQVSNVRFTAGNEAVQAEQLPIALQQVVAQVRAKETGAPCDDCSHRPAFRSFGEFLSILSAS